MPPRHLQGLLTSQARPWVHTGWHQAQVLNHLNCPRAPCPACHASLEVDQRAAAAVTTLAQQLQKCQGCCAWRELQWQHPLKSVWAVLYLIA
jgi:hypothetical protein